MSQTSLTPTATQAPNLAMLFLNRVAASADREAFRYPENGKWASVTWKQAAERVEVLAAGLLSLMGVFDLVGTTASGWLTDRFDPRKLLFAYYGLRGLSLIALPFSAFDPVSLSVFAIFYGLDWIATVPPTLRLANENFGERDAPVVFGWVLALLPDVTLKLFSDLLGFVVWYVVSALSMREFRSLALITDQAQAAAQRGAVEAEAARQREQVHGEIHGHLLPIVEFLIAGEPINERFIRDARRAARRARRLIADPRAASHQTEEAGDFTALPPCRLADAPHVVPHLVERARRE